METRPTRLHLQQEQTSSCWLFVLEAIAHAHGLPTTALKIAMHAYPDDADVARRAYPGSGLEDEDSNLVALRLMAENLDDMCAELESLQARGRSWVSEERLLSLAQSKLKSTECVKFIRFNSSKEARIGSLVDIFNRAYKKAVRVLRIQTEARVPGSGKLLQGPSMNVEPYDQRGAEAALEAMHSEMPVFLGIRARYALRQEDLHSNGAARTRVDWTGRRDAMQPSNHALLLTGYDSRGGIVSYKDPNYGNMEIRITTEQFTMMAGNTGYDQYLDMKSFSHHGRLRELAG
jgi:hypothetical protein